MSMTKKIYIVVSSHGEYEDYREYLEKAFYNKKDAEKYAKEIDVKHNHRPEFITDSFLEDIDDIEDNLPDWGPCDLQGKAYYEWVDKNNKREDEEIIKAIIAKGYTFNREMYDEFREWEGDRYTDWHPCCIEEIELV